MCESLELQTKIHVSRKSVPLLTDVVNDLLAKLAVDLAAFSKHARRTTVTIEDVKLSVRRNPTVHHLISDFASEMKAQTKNSVNPLPRVALPQPEILTNPDDSHIQALKFQVAKISEGMEVATDLQVSRKCVPLLADLVHGFAFVHAKDLLAFKKHSKRTTVSGEDVKLCARHDPALVKQLNEKSSETEPKPKRHKGPPKPAFGVVEIDSSEDEDY
eukprot:c14766_g1_i1.p1 GENE.c14766_g1_i1~~c14766_g1_i1.p1  ORF type:complete len:253 (-),score=55.58 c14766_g1_i1:22-669(-)